LVVVKLLVGFNLIKMARARIQKTSNASVVAAAAVAGINAGLQTTPKFRKGSTTSLVNLERQQQASGGVAGVFQPAPIQLLQQRRPSQVMTPIFSSAGGGGGGGGAVTPTTALGPNGSVATDLTGDDRYGSFVPLHVLAAAAGGPGVVEKDANMVMMDGERVVVVKDDKLDRVDRYAMVKSRIV
ncbi:hypothetical protein HDU98_000970, partial [Podochytrium sp. JEL0797]